VHVCRATVSCRLHCRVADRPGREGRRARRASLALYLPVHERSILCTPVSSGGEIPPPSPLVPLSRHFSLGVYQSVARWPRAVVLSIDRLLTTLEQCQASDDDRPMGLAARRPLDVGRRTTGRPADATVDRFNEWSSNDSDDDDSVVACTIATRCRPFQAHLLPDTVAASASGRRADERRQLCIIA